MIVTDEIKKDYQENEDFKTFVDAFAEATKRSPSDVLECATVHEVWKAYKDRK